jgi:hypothetical protein
MRRDGSPRIGTAARRAALRFAAAVLLTGLVAGPASGSSADPVAGTAKKCKKKRAHKRKCKKPVADQPVAPAPPTAARISISPTSHDYGAGPIFENSPPFPFTVSNAGGSASGTPVISYSGPNANRFSTVSTTCTSSLAPGGSCTINVIYNWGPGSSSAALDVAATPGGTVSAALSGAAGVV